MNVFRCGRPRCGREVSGIYCDQHQRPVDTVRPRAYPGETVHFLYRGKDKEGIVEQVMRTKCVVHIILNSGIGKFVTVNMEELHAQAAPDHARD